MKTGYFLVLAFLISAVCSRPLPPLERTKLVARQDSPPENGYYLDPCDKQEDCLFPNSCLSIEEIDGISQFVQCENTEGEGCACLRSEVSGCTSCKGCPSKETCVNIDEEDPGFYQCVSVNAAIRLRLLGDKVDELGCTLLPTMSATPSVTPTISISPLPPSLSPSPSVSPTTDVCIDAKLVSKEQRLFTKNRRANVLCDGNDSCATPGHMVVFNGVPMSMSEYCESVSARCTQKVILVNSPKFAFGVRVKSQTSGLEFSALAARYESRFEKAFLAAALRYAL